MTINIFGYGYGLAGSDGSTELGPQIISLSPFLNELSFDFSLHPTITTKKDGTKQNALEGIQHCHSQLMEKITSHPQEKFAVIGGDHSSAMGTLQAVQHNIDTPVKLLWVDAHMDSHTFKTSVTSNIHGMSLAALLGHGGDQLQTLFNSSLTLKPENVCLIGIRSYEPEEKELLDSLGVKIIYMEEIDATGISKCLDDALSYLNPTQPQELVLSIDLDAFSPEDAPAVTVPEPNGIRAKEFLAALQLQRARIDQSLVGIEIVEFSPKRDKNNQTEQLIITLLNSIFDER